VEPVFFATPAEFRAWLAEHAGTERGLLVGFHKKDSGRPSITWPESVDQALCFGWIDGIRRSLGEHAYTIRFTPRKPNSVWSAVNVSRVAELTGQGLMTPAGIAAFERRSDNRNGVYSFEQGTEPEFDGDLRATFEAQPAAWAFFQAQPISYRRAATWWVISAKRADTRQRRLANLIEDSANKRRLRPLSRG
jgi:uncharacterized protein YdeI (YjbR/CyaY-like superfamily)